MSCDNANNIYKKCGICGQIVPAETLGLLLDRQACIACRKAAKMTQDENFDSLDLCEKELLYQIRAEQRGNTWLLRGILISLVILVIPFDGKFELSPAGLAILAIAFVTILLSLVPGRKIKEEITSQKDPSKIESDD